MYMKVSPRHRVSLSPRHLCWEWEIVIHYSPRPRVSLIPRLVSEVEPHPPHPPGISLVESSGNLARGISSTSGNFSKARGVDWVAPDKRFKRFGLGSCKR